MGSMSVDGLVSGLATTDLINSLLAAEATPQRALQTKVAAQNKAVTGYQNINAKMAALLTAAKALTSTNAWGAVKTTSSSAAAAVSATAGAATGSLTFKVDSLAAAHTVTFAGRVSSATDATGSPVITGSTLDVLLKDGSTATITPTDASLSAVVKKINETPNAAYRAAAVQVSPGQYTLQLTAVESGATSAFANAFADVDPSNDTPAALSLGAAAISTQGTNAQLTVGTDSTYTITSTTNNFTDILPGVTVTAAKKQTAADDPVTVTISTDADAMSAKVQALVDAANAALLEVEIQGRLKKGEAPAGALAGDSAIRKITQQILEAVGGGAGGGLGSLSAVGVELDRYGKLTFDKAKFGEAFNADAVKTQSYFDSYTDVPHAGAVPGFNPGWDTASGIARKLETIGLIATEGVRLPTDGPGAPPREGTLAGMIRRRNDFIGNLNDRVSEWDTRLDARRLALQKQFASMETALSSMKQQSSWLAGQIASLPSYS